MPGDVFERDCAERMGAPFKRRPANALNVEIGAPQDRCRLKTPSSWRGADPRAARWLASGGSALVLGLCGGNCPRLAQRSVDEERRSAPLGVADAVFEVARHVLGGAVLKDVDERASVGPYRTAVGETVLYGAFGGGDCVEQCVDADLFNVARWFVWRVGIDGTRRALRRHFAKAQEACG